MSGIKLPRAIGPYRIEAKLGQGGMGLVFKARHETLERPCAIKLLPKDLALSPEHVARFLREARVVATLHHEHVLEVFDAGREDETYYIAMELVEGISLGTYLQERERLPEDEALELLRQAALGLQAAHEKGLVHRDIKPDNLLLSQDRKTLRVADFGLVMESAGTTQLTATGAAVGTPQYMSPEQTDGEKADARTDLYALGVTFYQAVTGRTPFHSPTVMNLLLKHKFEPPPDPRSLNPDLSDNLRNLLLTLLAKKRHERPQSAQELVRLIEVIRAGGRIPEPKPFESSLDLQSRALRDEAEASKGAWELGGERSTKSSLLPLTAAITAILLASAAGIWWVTNTGSARTGRTAKTEPALAGKPPAAEPSEHGTEAAQPASERKTPAEPGPNTGPAAETGPLEPEIFGPQPPEDRTEAPAGPRTEEAPPLAPGPRPDPVPAAQAPGAQPAQKPVPQPGTLPAEKSAPGPEEEKAYRLWDGREAVADYARDQGLAPSRELTLGAGIRMGFALVPAAAFVMGSPEGEPERRDDERPHRVTITRPFYMGRYEVTQEEYEAVIGPGSNRSQWRGHRRPVERVSYYDALEFCSQLNRKTRKLVRLPREAEWELACRAGTQSAYHFGARIGPELANYESHKQAALSESREGQNATLPVGSFPPNAWGLHDMHGNVWEWCADWYGEYGKGPVSDPLGPSLGTRRVQRGGSWYSKSKYCRAACRDQDKPDDRDSHYGFRVLLEVD